MIDLSFKVANITISPYWWIGIVSFCVAGFAYWQKMRFEESTDQIYLSIGYVLGSFVVLVIALGVVLPGLGLAWASLWLPLCVWVRDRKSPIVWEKADGYSRAYVLLIVGFGCDLFLTGDWRGAVVAIFGLALLAAWGVMARKYRTFSWYPSGKTGFLACATGGITSLVFLVLAIGKITGIYWESLIWVGLGIMYVSFGFFRSENTLTFKRKRKLLS